MYKFPDPQADIVPTYPEENRIMDQKLRNFTSWLIASVFSLSIAASSALHAVITPVAQDTPVIPTSGTPRTQPPVQHMEWVEVLDGSDWHGQELATDYVPAFHPDPGLRHRLLYRELSKRARGTVTAETAIGFGSE